jgi:DSF synthase
MGAIDFNLPATHNPAIGRVYAEMEQAKVNTLWVTMGKDPKGGIHNFSLPLLAELRNLVQTVKSSNGHWNQTGQPEPIHYAVMKSDDPEYFNLGGDLDHFRACIAEGNRAGLYDYSKQCLDLMYDWATLSSGKMTTIALVQGRALGGGFECALSADYLIAEEHSSFGFPEIMFGLFPCTGGMSLLARRVGVYQAERMMTNKRIYTAPELLEMGVIDEMCPTGQGPHAVEKFIESHASRRMARMMLQASRHRIAPLDYAELARVVDDWVEAAMHLTPEELRAMDMLIMMQKGPQARRTLRLAA